MRITKALLILSVCLAIAATGSSQASLTGRIVEVVDGKTFVIETEGGRITGTIKYVEVPEPEQPLSRMVREHLEKLALGKTITFIPNGFSPSAIAGKAYLNGLDLGQQLVRDGAAWHLPQVMSGQDAADSEIYDSYEELAKREKRGIWSIANLTPAWEFRSRKGWSQDFSFAQAGLRDPGSRTDGNDKKNYLAAVNDADMWVEVGGPAFAQKNSAGSLFWGYDVNKKIRNTSTASIAQEIAAGGKRLEVEVRVVYFQGEIRPRASNTAIVIGILATSPEHNFAKDNTLVFVADGKEVVIGAGQRFWRESSSSVQELVQYRIARNDLAAIANAEKLTLKAGEFSGTVGIDLRGSLKALLNLAQ